MIGSDFITFGNNHGFKNRYGEKTGKETDYWFFGPTGVRPVVKPVTS